MAVALLYPEEGKKGRGHKDPGREMATSGRFSRTRLSEARTVLKYRPDLAPKVLSDGYPLSKAYEDARKRQEQDTGEAMKAARRTERMTALREVEPELSRDIWTMMRTRRRSSSRST
jgi:hypothetical protein